MLTQFEFRETTKRALKLEGIKRFEKHLGKIKFLHPEEEKKESKNDNR